MRRRSHGRVDDVDRYPEAPVPVPPVPGNGLCDERPGQQHDDRREQREKASDVLNDPNDPNDPDRSAWSERPGRGAARAGTDAWSRHAPIVAVFYRSRRCRAAAPAVGTKRSLPAGLAAGSDAVTLRLRAPCCRRSQAAAR